MKRIDVSALTIGMILAQDVYDYEGLLLVSAGTKLLDIHIDFIKKKLVTEVFISEITEETSVVNIPLPALEDQRPYEKAVDELKQKYNTTVDAFKSIFYTFKLGRIPLAEEIDDVVEPMLDAILKDNSFAHKLWQIQTTDAENFDHSVKVSMIAGVLAKWCKLNRLAIKEIVIAGLMHDIGKCNIPDELLDKEELTDEEEKVFRTHAILGYMLLKEMPSMSDEIREIVLQHHEYVDGSGYPHGLKGDRISYSAKIVTVANVYSNLVKNRKGKAGMHPFDAMTYMLENLTEKLDYSVVRIFLSNVVHFYIGSKVKLDTGEIGTVVMTYKMEPSRPMLKVGPDYIDLRKNFNYNIVSFMDS